MRHRGILAVVIAAAVCGAGWLPPHAVAAPAPPPMNHAESAVLIDVHSGRILYSKNGDKEMRIASLTKIMTSILAIESGRLSDQVTVSSRAYGTEGSSIYLKLGQKISLQDLLYGLMLRSGNDAAVAIAEHVGGSIEGFAYMMNEKAEWLGLKHTHFVNPHGLDAKDHYSSANDLAVLTAYALGNPVFRDIVKTKVKTVPNPDGEWNYRWNNKNKMLSLYEGADGVKTGYTKTANRCLVSSATRNGQQLAVVTLNDSYDWADHQLLLDYGFEHFPQSRLIEQGSVLPALHLAVGQSVDYPLNEGESALITRRAERVDPDSTDYRLGLRGRLTFYLKGQSIASVPLYTVDHPQVREESGAAFAPDADLDSVLKRVFRSLFLSA